MLPTYRRQPRGGRGAAHGRWDTVDSRPSAGLWSLSAVVLCISCLADGSVELDLELAERADLSVGEAEVAEISLVTYLPDDSPRSETRQIAGRDQSLSMGRMEIADGVSLAIELRTPNRRLVGYGRSPGPIDVLADEVVRVPVKVRRPFVYLTGASTLATFDSTRDALGGSGYRASIALPRPADVVAPTSDGADLVVISTNGVGGSLQLVSTSTHEPSTAAPIPLTMPASDAAVSPDNSVVVVGHAGANGGLSIVDLAEAREGRAAVQFVALGSVGAVAIGSRTTVPRVVALLDRATGSGCPQGGAPSSLVAVRMDDIMVPPAMINLQAPIHDLAISGDGQFVVLADSCANRLQKINLDDDIQPEPLAMITDPSTVAVFDDRAWAVGTLPATTDRGRRLIVVSVQLDGTGETRLELPPAEERAKSDDFSGDGQAAEQRMDADDLHALDIAVAPGSDHLAITTWAYFHANEVGDFLGAPIIPQMQIEAHEYVLINGSTNAIVQRVRTQCQLEWESDPFNPPILNSWRCTQAAGQDITETSYVPRHLSILYGAR